MAGNGTASEDTLNEPSTYLVVLSLHYSHNVCNYLFVMADTDTITNTVYFSNGKTRGEKYTRLTRLFL